MVCIELLLMKFEFCCYDLNFWKWKFGVWNYFEVRSVYFSRAFYVLCFEFFVKCVVDLNINVLLLKVFFVCWWYVGDGVFVYFVCFCYVVGVFF